MNIRMMAVAAFAASCAFGGARIETPLGGDGWKLWLDKKAEYKSDQLHLNPTDAAKIRANAGDWLTLLLTDDATAYLIMACACLLIGAAAYQVVFRSRRA